MARNHPRRLEGREHDATMPDVQTASEPYARRFAGPVGAWLLSVQEQHVLRMLAAHGAQGCSILELGGGHAQLAAALLAAGHEVVEHGSTPAGATRLRPLLARHPERLHFVSSSLWQLPFADLAFDVVIALRLLAHVERWQELLGEMARVSRCMVLVDFPPRSSMNLLAPAQFALKRWVEGDTRPFFSYATRELYEPLRAAGFRQFCVRRQFFLPMALHRGLRAPALSAGLEQGFRRLGLTGLLGGPALLAATHRESPRAT